MTGRPNHHDFGTVRPRVAELAKERGYYHDTGLHKGKVNSSGLARDLRMVESAVWPLLRAPERRSGITFEVIARLCAVLRCQPGDLFEYLPPGQRPGYTLPERAISPEGEAINEW